MPASVAADAQLAGSVADPAMSRRHAAGAASARGLLFTVLGEYVLPGGGRVWTSAVIAAMARLGVEEKAARQALMRTAADGWLTAERAGRRTRWELTEAGDRLLTEGTQRIYGFGADGQEWDGTWLLVLARAPESAARHVLRSRLTWAGFGSPGPGVWVSTHAERRGEVQAILVEAGLATAAHVFTGTHSGGGELESLVAQAFDLAGIRRQYDDFLAEFADRGPVPDPLARSIELVHAWRRFPWTDPDLPRQLLPAQWSGSRAAALFRDQHAQWAPAARAAWRDLSADVPGFGG